MSTNAPALSPEARRLLETTRELIREPEHWTQHTDARTRGGRPVPATSQVATCWCLVGARAKVTHDLGISEWSSTAMEVRRALRQASQALFGVNYVTEVNDLLGHAAVLRLLAVALGEDDPGVES